MIEPGTRYPNLLDLAEGIGEGVSGSLGPSTGDDAGSAPPITQMSVCVGDDTGPSISLGPSVGDDENIFLGPSVGDDASPEIHD